MTEYRLPRLMIAGTASGAGKTMITCGLLQIFLNMELDCVSYKCGPDYIDPIFHKYVLGVEGGNLDSYFQDQQGLLDRLVSSSGEGKLALIEGVMGYYDGLGGVSTKASSYEIARMTKTPAVLVLDARGSSLSLAAQAKGFLTFCSHSNIQGVILNRTTRTVANRLKPVFEEMGLPVLGYLPILAEAEVESRHLGLSLSENPRGMRNQIMALAEKMKETIDIDRLYRMAVAAPDLMGSPEMKSGTALSFQPPQKNCRIAIARDEAFCFYYQENLKLLEALGAELIFFSPVHDTKLPQMLDGMILGGGYPELFGAALAENRGIREEIKNAGEQGLPILAECGGFLYLHRQIEDKNGCVYPMTGLIEADGYPKNRLERFGYIELTPDLDTPLLEMGEGIKGHEFHYWDSTDPGIVMTAVKPFGAGRWSCYHQNNNIFAGFPHLYYPSNPEFIKRWLKICTERKGETNGHPRMDRAHNASGRAE